MLQVGCVFGSPGEVDGLLRDSAPGGVVWGRPRFDSKRSGKRLRKDEWEVVYSN